MYTCVCFRPGYLTQSYTVDEMTQVLAIHRLCAWERKGKSGKGTNASAPIRSEMCVCASGGDHAHVSLAFFSLFQSSPLLDDDGKGRRRRKGIKEKNNRHYHHCRRRQTHRCARDWLSPSEPDVLFVPSSSSTQPLKQFFGKEKKEKENDLREEGGGWCRYTVEGP